MNGAELQEHNQAVQAEREARGNRPSFDALPEPEPTLRDQHDEEIASRVSAYNEKVKAIRADANLSDKGKADALRTLYDAASGQVAAMHGASQETVETRTNSLTRRLFGITDSPALDYRNAQDRVQDIRLPERLADLMDQAEATGDKTLLKAGFAHAWQRSRDPLASDMWAGIVSEYVRVNPGVADSLNELERLTTSRGRTAEMTRRMVTSVSKPKEIR